MDVGRGIAAITLGEVGPQCRSPTTQQRQREQDEYHPDHRRRSGLGPSRGAGSDSLAKRHSRARPPGSDTAAGVAWLWFIGTTPSSLVFDDADCPIRGDLVASLDVDVQSLQQGEPCKRDDVRQLIHQRGESRRWLAVDRHVVVGSRAAEQLRELPDVLRVLDQGVGVYIALDLAPCSVVAQEPVVAERLRVLLSAVCLIISAACRLNPSSSPSRIFSRAVTSNMSPASSAAGIALCATSGRVFSSSSWGPRLPLPGRRDIGGHPCPAPRSAIRLNLRARQRRRA